MFITFCESKNNLIILRYGSIKVPKNEVQTHCSLLVWIDLRLKFMGIDGWHISFRKGWEMGLSRVLLM